jgi:serine protease AprX
MRPNLKFGIFFSGLLWISPFFVCISQEMHKIQPILLKEVEAGLRPEYLVVFKEQADVTSANEIVDWDERGTYVYTTLKNIADLSQRNALNILNRYAKVHNNFRLKFKPFWIVNSIHVDGGDLNLIYELSKLPEVQEIQAGGHFISPAKSMDLTGVGEANEIKTRMPTAEWGLINAKARQVWTLGHKGAGVVIGGQDTGYKWDHVAIKQSYRGWNGSSANHDYNWFDAIDTLISAGTNPCGLKSPFPCDDGSHGTHTMGTMVGLDGSDTIGMAPQSKWIGCRNMDRGDGRPWTYIDCFQWFLAPTTVAGTSPDVTKRPDVINNSWGCPTSELCNTLNFWIMEGALNNLRNAGTVIVVSAGNSGPSCNTIDSPPAIYPNGFAVGAFDISNNIASFSSRGSVTYNSITYTKPDIAAPGVNVRSCINPSGYANFSGTSMAGPHTAGAVALLISARPALKGQPATIENLLRSKAVPVTASSCGGTTPNNIWGSGRLDVFAAVQQALPVDMVHFRGRVIEKYHELQWETRIEDNLLHFEIQVSSENQGWTDLGIVTRPELDKIYYKSYKFKTLPISKGPLKYRIKILDRDGSFEYSPLVVLSSETGIDAKWLLVSDPSNKKIRIWIPEGYTTLENDVLSIINISGQTVQESNTFLQSGWNEIHMQEIPSGIYQVWAKRSKNLVGRFSWIP